MIASEKTDKISRFGFGVQEPVKNLSKSNVDVQQERTAALASDEGLAMHTDCVTQDSPLSTLYDGTSEIKSKSQIGDLNSFSS